MEGHLPREVVHAAGVHETQGVPYGLGTQHPLACDWADAPMGQRGGHDTPRLTGHLYGTQLKGNNLFTQTSRECLLCLQCLWLGVRDSVPVTHCPWFSVCDSVSVTQWLWPSVCDSVSVTHCPWLSVCDSVSVTQCLWLSVCDSSYILYRGVTLRCDIEAMTFSSNKSSW